MKLKIYTDWWSRWNPWNAWIWVYITDFNWKVIEKRYKNIWIKTNNEAEYMWAYFWIKRWIEIWWDEIDLYSDSNLLIKQLSGEWKIKKEELKRINKKIHDMIDNSKIKINFNWIERELNKEADRLSNLAMDLGN